MKRSSATSADPETGVGGIDAAACFAGLAGAQGIVLAVSGGPDSTALMVLAAAWQGRPPVLVVTVDHGLRPESADEARLVERNAAALGFPCRRVCCAAIAPGGNLQARARAARYEALAGAAKEAGFDTVVTAHHRDDQAETFLMRLARGSGVYGLGAIRRESVVAGVRVARPLLGIPRETLARIARASGLPLVEDPSNRDGRFDRVRIRDLMPVAAGHGISAERLAGTATRLARAADALDALAGDLIRTHAAVDRFGVARMPVRPILLAHPEVALRVLSRLVSACGGADYPPGEAPMEALLAALAASPGDKLRRTVHGVVVSSASAALAVQREWGRAGLPDLAVEPGSVAIWDGRYRISVPDEAGADRISPLGSVSDAVRACDADRTVLRTAPGLFGGARLFATLADIERRDRGRPDWSTLTAECLVGLRLGLAAGLPGTSGAVPKLTEPAGYSCTRGADTITLAPGLRQPI